MKYPQLFISLAVLILVSSCCQNLTVQCSTGTVNVELLGFNSNDLAPDSPYVVRYKQDNAFDVVIDTVTTSIGSYSTDTLPLLINIPDTVSTGGGSYSIYPYDLLPGYDYKIIFPADTLTYAITNLNVTGSNQMTIKRCGDTDPPTCFKNVTTCNVNGNSATTQLSVPQVAIYQQRNTSLYLIK